MEPKHSYVSFSEAASTVPQLTMSVLHFLFIDMNISFSSLTWTLLESRDTVWLISTEPIFLQVPPAPRYKWGHNSINVWTLMIGPPASADPEASTHLPKHYYEALGSPQGCFSHAQLQIHCNYAATPGDKWATGSPPFLLWVLYFQIMSLGAKVVKNGFLLCDMLKSLKGELFQPHVP